MSLLGDLLDARRGAPAEPVEEAFNTRLHPHAPHGPHGGQFIRTLGAVRSPAGGRTRIPEGSGPSNPTARAAGRPPKVRSLAPRAPGADVVPGPNARKLTEKELPKAVGRGPWSRPAKAVVDDLHTGKIEDTEHAHREVNPDGSMGFYKPERIALHQQIVKALFQGAGSHPEDKQATFLAGGPASGKSTLVRSGDVKLPPDFVDINPDIIRTMLPEYKPLVAAGDTKASSKTHEEASHISKMAMNLAMLRDHHVVVDGVGNSGPGKFAGKIRAALEHGYDVSVVYATIETEEAVRRATARAENPKSDSYGRHVPTGYLRSSHRDVTVRFRDDVSKMKGVHVRVFDTSKKRPRMVAEVGKGGELRVQSRKLFKAFMGKAGAGA